MPQPTVVPLSPAQQRLWTSTQIRPDDPFFHIPFVVDLDGPLDAPLLRRCVTEVIRRHLPLRARVHLRDGAPCLVSPPADQVAFDWFRGRVLDVGDDEEARREIDAVGRAPFDLGVGPPLRAQLIRVGPRRHLLAVTVHHLVFDGWSLDVFMGELVALLRAGADPDRAFPGARPDYAGYLARHDAGRSREADTAFWTARLAGAPAVIPLPGGRVRPTRTDHEAARYTRTLPAAWFEPLRALARANRVTPFIVLKAACDVALSHYGASDVVTGVALAGRDRADSHPLIGYLARPIVLRSDLRADPSFRVLLRSVRDDLLDAHEHPELPFDAVARALGVPPDPSYNPLYQVMFAFATQRPAYRAGDLRLTVTEYAPATMKVELSVVCTQTADGDLRVDIDHRRDLFAEADMVRFADRLQTVLTHAVADPDATVAGLRRLGDVEFRAAVTAPNPPRAESVGTDEATGQAPAGWSDLRDLVDRVFDRAATAPDALAVAAATAPDALAVAAATAPDALAVAAGPGGPPLTYRGLADAVRATARRLTAAGVGPGDRVGLCAGPSGDLVAGLLAVVWVGATGVLLDPAWPAFALRNAQAEAGFGVVLTDSGPANLFDRDLVDVLDIRAGEPAAPGPHGPGVTAGQDRVAFVAYDDQDDEQQAVVLSERLVTVVLRGLCRDLDPPPEVVVPLTGTTSSIGVVVQALLATALGGTCVPVADEPAAVAGATVIVAPTDLVRRWAPVAPAGAVVVAHGAALPAGTVRLLRDERRVRAVRHLFGPPAAGGYALLDGRPRAGSRVYLLGPDDEPVPPGAPGEIVVGGTVLADGYLDEHASAEEFRPDPLANHPAARRFATGWLGRLTPDGRVEILGDAREPLTRHGHRVDLGPIEDVLTGHPGVAAATVRPWGPADARWVLALVARRPSAPGGAGDLDGRVSAPGGAGDLDTRALAAYLAARLPGYLRPDRIVVLDALPADAEEIDRVLAADAAAERVADEPPRGEARLVAAAWEKVLGRAVPPDVNFFDAGGDSLLLIRLRDELQAGLGVEVTLTDLFSHPTIRAMTETLGRPGATTPSSTSRGEARRRAYAQRGR